jgi:DNA-binding CsgD family transcriptional regulator
MKLGRQLASARDAATGDLLEQMPQGAVLVDSRGQILRVNAAARPYMGGAIACEHGRLVAGGAGAAAFHELLSQILSERHAVDAKPTALSDYIALPRRMAPPLLANVVPVDGTFGHLFRDARAIVLLNDVNAASPIEEATCRSLFSLTPAEARLAVAIAGGANPAGFAEVAGLSLATVRTRMKTVFAKTGTRRQAELAAVLGRLRRDLVSPRSGLIESPAALSG